MIGVAPLPQAILIPNNNHISVLPPVKVESIEKDGVVNISTVVAGPAVVKRTQITQKPAPWNLARISHRNNGPADYTYDNTAGQGVRVYVIDTGIQITHQEFEGRAVWGANFVSGSQNTDENGHGTHVSGTVGGKNFGVAKQATLVAVKVLDAGGSGSISGVISGIQWAVNDAINKRVAPKSVINMSLGGSVSSQLNSAVLAATNAGLTVAVAAGNSNVNASTFSPASAPSAITVAATDGTDVRAWFSNWGAVDIFAPGESVLSSWTGGSNSEARYLAGTSMGTSRFLHLLCILYASYMPRPSCTTAWLIAQHLASPHIAGLAAYFIAAEGLSGSSAVTNRILGAATPGIVGDPRGSPNLFAYNADGL